MRGVIMVKHPVWLWIDPTRNCNLACKLCYTKLSHNKDVMEPDTLETILDNLLSETSIQVKMIHLNWRGEPLMNRKFHQLLDIVLQREIGVPIHWHTNGMLLTPNRVEELLRLRGDYTVYVSIDGGNTESHDKNRGDGSFEASITGLQRLL